MRGLRIFAVSLMFIVGTVAYSQPGASMDVFYPIAKYMEQGDAEKLSAWFDDHMEISVNGVCSDSGRNQARQILKLFFDGNRPSAFSIRHTASKANMKYALGAMTIASVNYNVTIFVNLRDDGYRIQQLKIEKVR